MNCPNCHAQNLPTDLRCLQCGASLVTDTVGGSESYRKSALQVDMRLYGRIGGGLGLALVYVLLNTVLSDVYLNRWQTYGAYAVTAIVFAVIGRFIASRKI